MIQLSIKRRIYRGFIVLFGAVVISANWASASQAPATNPPAQIVSVPPVSSVSNLEPPVATERGAATLAIMPDVNDVSATTAATIPPVSSVTLFNLTQPKTPIDPVSVIVNPVPVLGALALIPPPSATPTPTPASSLSPIATPAVVPQETITIAEPVESSIPNIPEAVTPKLIELPADPPPLPTSTPTPITPAIAPQAIAAVAWAYAELHSPDPSWSNQLRGPWSGYCEAFVEIAYGTRHHYASASANYQAHLRAGLIHTDNNPPIGALVYYGGGQYGHVALSVGGGRIITTLGQVNQRLPISEISLSSLKNPYLGWAHATY